MVDDSIYLDYNATTPIAPEVVAAISASLAADWGNPSSNHFRGIQAKAKIDKARTQLAQSINGTSDQIIFTSGGTEALNWVIYSICRGKDVHVITTKLEHCAVINPLKSLESEGVSVDYISPETGKFHVHPDDIINAIRPTTALIAVMMANNETGAIQPVAAIGEKIAKLNAARDVKIKFLVDASQAYGKIAVDVDDIRCDFLVLAGHKFYAPRIGALYARCPDNLSPLILGGGQEKGRRSGTENTPMIVGLGKAAEMVWSLFF